MTLLSNLVGNEKKKIDIKYGIIDMFIFAHMAQLHGILAYVTFTNINNY